MDGIICSPLCAAIKFQASNLARKRAQHGLAFGAGDILTDAGMDADTKREVAASAARDVKLMRLRPLRGIEVGGAEHAEYFAASADVDVAHGGVLGRRATERMYGRGKA